MTTHFRRIQNPRNGRRGTNDDSGIARGKIAEDRFLAICLAAQELGQFPPWLSHVRKATQKEDLEEKTDFVAITDRGDIRIQVKSSLTGWYAFLRENKGTEILCLVVSPNATSRLIWDLTLEDLTRAYDELMHPDWRNT